MHRTLARILACTVAVALATAALAADVGDLDTAFEALKAYDWGGGREAVEPIDKAVNEAGTDAKLRADLEKRLLEVATAETASRAARQFTCRMLSLIASPTSVPKLAPMLTDPELSHAARMVLERVGDPTARTAMRKAVPRAQGDVKIGLINSLGVLRDAEAAEMLMPMLQATDAELASAAAYALGRIATPRAAVALVGFQKMAPEALQPAAVDACLTAAGELLAAGQVDAAATIFRHLNQADAPAHVKMAAFQGLVAADPEQAKPRILETLASDNAQTRGLAVRLIAEAPPGAETTKAFAEAYDSLETPAKTALLAALERRGDVAARPTVLKAVESDVIQVRLAAVRALAALGTADDVPLLVKRAAAEDEEAKAAQRSLTELGADGVDAKLIQQLGGASPGEKLVLVQALTSRSVDAAVPALLEEARGTNDEIAAEACEALGRLAEVEHAAALVALVKDAGSDGRRAAAEKALLAVCGRKKGEAEPAVLAGLKGASPAATAALVRALGHTRGKAGYAEVMKATKSDSADVQDAAIRVLTSWPDAAAADDILAVAQTSENRVHQVLALRGYVDLARGVRNEEKKLDMLAKALAAAARPDEKRLVLGALGDVHTTESLRMATGLIDEPGLAEDACPVVVRIAEKMKNPPAEVVRPAMENVMSTTKNKKVKDAAAKLLGKAGPKPRLTPRAEDNRGPFTIYAAPLAKRDDSAAEKLGWRLACQTYTFRKLTFFETLDKLAALGIKYVEVWPGQRVSPDLKEKMSPGMSPEVLEQVRAKLKETGIQPVCIGVTGVNEETCRFATALGIEVITSETKPSEEVDALLAKYDLREAIHNHPNSWPPEEVLKACEGRSTRIGACADTGHWMRRGLNPVETLKALEGRIVSVHFKDLNEYGGKGKKPHDVPWGTGQGDARGQLSELHRQGFKGVVAIEYEHGSVEDLMENLPKCIRFFDATAAELAAE